MNIRNCTESDFSDCAKVLCDTYAEPPYGESWEWGDAVSYLSRFYSFDPALCFVATVDNEIVGALFAYSYPWRGGENCYIQEIFVSPRLQGAGVGKKLIEKLSASKNGNSTWLVANEKSRATEFYKSLGFSNNGPYRFYHGQV